MTCGLSYSLMTSDCPLSCEGGRAGAAPLQRRARTAPWECPVEGPGEENVDKRGRNGGGGGKEGRRGHNVDRPAGSKSSCRRQTREGRRRNYRARGCHAEGRQGLPCARGLPGAWGEGDGVERDRRQEQDALRGPARAPDRMQLAPGCGRAPRQKARRPLFQPARRALRAPGIVPPAALASYPSLCMSSG